MRQWRLIASFVAPCATAMAAWQIMAAQVEEENRSEIGPDYMKPTSPCKAPDRPSGMLKASEGVSNLLPGREWQAWGRAFRSGESKPHIGNAVLWDEYLMNDHE